MKQTSITHLSYAYVPDMSERRTPYRADHLARLQAFESRGLLLAGAHIEPLDSAEFLFATASEAQEFLEGDPYRLNGLVTDYTIRTLVAVAGSFLPPSKD
jgi:hypothetical protein